MSDFYYEVKPGTEAHQLIKDGREMKRKWNSKEMGNKMAEFLGIESGFINSNLFLIHGQLVMTNPPDHLKDQFKKPNRKGHCGAKQELNKKWIDFCKENELKSADYLSDFRIKYGLYFTAMTFWLFDDRFFIECKTSNLHEQEKRDFLVPVEKVEFLKIHLAYEEKCKEEDAQKKDAKKENGEGAASE